MQLDPLLEMVLVTIFMEGLRTGLARAEIMWVHPTSFDEAVDVALNAEFNFKAARFGTRGYNPNSANSFSSPNRPEPRVLFASPIHTNKQSFDCGKHRHILRCFT